MEEKKKMKKRTKGFLAVVGERHRPRVGFEIVGDYVHQGRFARPVRSEKGADARRQGCGEAAERPVLSV